MLKLIAKTGLALALTLGGAAAPISFAQAQDLQFRIGPDGVRIYDGDRDRYDRYDRYPDYRRGCSPREAVMAARDSGLRRAEVVRVTDRSVTVRGWTRYGPDRIVFANRRGCPEIG
ncbi:hypothetical protein HGP14_13715 [Rhizobium sp. P32RR-XVIII]|uniref:hypothetical protein n=1 Tax=Rhizobium sp. P32RR-XVIII TaxID=2726738 RepID=UPI0014569A04|nr:hypothetical protein [Rhizobium sp. P32RR-XVIII]NLS04409.1 hypothetical protein [Rhizobium sp. P32RR-XVIII]